MQFFNPKQIEALVKKGKKETEAKIAQERALAIKREIQRAEREAKEREAKEREAKEREAKERLEIETRENEAKKKEVKAQTIKANPIKNKKKKKKTSSSSKEKKQQNSKPVISYDKRDGEELRRDQFNLREARKHYERVVRERPNDHKTATSMKTLGQALDDYLVDSNQSVRYREIQNRAKEKRGASIPLSCMVKHGFRN